MNSQQIFVSFSQSTLHPRSFYPILMCLYVRLFFSLSFPLSSHLIAVPLFLCSSVQPPHLLSSSLLFSPLHSSFHPSTSLLIFPMQTCQVSGQRCAHNRAIHSPAVPRESVWVNPCSLVGWWCVCDSIS